MSVLNYTPPPAPPSRLQRLKNAISLPVSTAEGFGVSAPPAEFGRQGKENLRAFHARREPRDMSQVPSKGWFREFLDQ